MTPRNVMDAIQFGAILLGVFVIAHEFWVQHPKDRALRNAELHAQLATLATSEDIEDTEVAIQKIMALMHLEGNDMAGISVPNATFRMGRFANAHWQDSFMKDVSFTCTPRAELLIDEFNGDSLQREPCAMLTHADFSGAVLDSASFKYADLHSAMFPGADLDRAVIYRSSLAKADLSHTDLSGIQIISADLGNATFSPGETFDCRRSTSHSEKRNDVRVKDVACVQLEEVDLSPVTMQKARFLGAEIRHVNFAGSDLHKARFGCDQPLRDAPKLCTTIESACLEGTTLTEALFDGVSIHDIDFSTSDITGAEFTNVVFRNVTFSAAQLGAVDFDDRSRRSLIADRQRTGDVDVDSDERPCAPKWREALTDWKAPIAFTP